MSSLLFISWFRRSTFIHLLILSLCKAFLFYDQKHIHELSNIDIYMQATRQSTATMSSNLTLFRLIYKNQPYVIDNLIKDGHFEGLSKGHFSRYSPHEINRPMVPYGCWYRKRNNTGIFVNLGSNVLLEEREALLLASPDHTDMYFCSKALKSGYTSIVTNYRPAVALLDSAVQYYLCTHRNPARLSSLHYLQLQWFSSSPQLWSQVCWHEVDRNYTSK